VSWRDFRRSDEARELGVLAAGFVGGWLIVRLSGSRGTVLRMSPPAEWLSAWAKLAAHAWRTFAPQYFVVFAVGCALLGAGALALRGVDAEGRQALRGGAALVVAAGGYFAYVGSLAWLRINDYDYRYTKPALLCLAVALLGIGVAGANAVFARVPPRAMAWAAAVTLVVVSAARYGLPSMERVRTLLNARIGQLTPELLGSGATHFAGGYWTVWPAVFHANWTRYEAGDDRQLFGVTDRSQPTEPLWRATDRATWRIAAKPDDPDAPRYLEQFKLAPLSEIGRTQSLVIYRAR
jgi:hypothetical protein